MNKFFRITLALVAAFAASGAQAARSENCASDPNIVAMPFLRHGTELKTVDEFVAVFKDGAGKLHKGVTVAMFRKEITRAIALARGYNTGAEAPMTDDQVLAVLAEAKIVDAKFLKGEAGVYGFSCEVGADGVQHAEKRQRASLPGERFVAIPVSKNSDGSSNWAVIASTICGNAMEYAIKLPLAPSVAQGSTTTTTPGGVIINNYNIQQAPATRIEPIPQTGTRIEALPQVAVAPAVAYAPQVGYGYGGVSVWPQVALGLGVSAINAWGNRPVVVTPQANTSTWTSNYSTVYNNTYVNRTGGPVLGPTGPGGTVGGPVLGNTGNFNTGRPVLGPTGAVGGGPVLR